MIEVIVLLGDAMGSAFWTNSIWYVSLGITSVISIVFILRKNENRKLNIAFMLAVLGVTYTPEAILLGAFGGGYDYYPKFSDNIFVDTVNGSYFSQFSITASLVLIAVYKLPAIWHFIIGAVYYLIEVLFVELGVYGHHWYRSWLTFIGVTLFSFLVTKWYNKLLKSPKFYIYYITLYLSVLPGYAHLLTIFIYSGLRVIHYNFYPDFFQDQFLCLHVQFLIAENIMIYLYLARLKWLTKGPVFLILFAAEYMLKITGIMYVKPGWFFIVAVVDLVGCYLWVALMDYLLTKGKSNLEAA